MYQKPIIMGLVRIFDNCDIFVSDVPLYLLGLPVFLLVLHFVPDGPPLQPRPEVRFGVGKFLIVLVICFGCSYAINIVGNLLITLIQAMFGYNGYISTSPLDSIPMDQSLLASFIFGAIVPATGEEFVFRYLIRRKMRGASDLSYIIISALCFGVFHLNLVQGFYAFVIGLVLGWVYVVTNKLWLTMLLHFIFNSFGMVVSSLVSESEILTLIWGILILMLIPAGVALFFVFRRYALATLRPPQDPAWPYRPAKPKTQLRQAKIFGTEYYNIFARHNHPEWYAWYAGQNQPQTTAGTQGAQPQPAAGAAQTMAVAGALTNAVAAGETSQPPAHEMQQAAAVATAIHYQDETQSPQPVVAEAEKQALDQTVSSPGIPQGIAASPPSPAPVQPAQPVQAVPPAAAPQTPVYGQAAYGMPAATPQGQVWPQAPYAWHYGYYGGNPWPYAAPAYPSQPVYPQQAYPAYGQPQPVQYSYYAQGQPGAAAQPYVAPGHSGYLPGYQPPAPAYQPPAPTYQPAYNAYNPYPAQAQAAYYYAGYAAQPPYQGYVNRPQSAASVCVGNPGMICYLAIGGFMIFFNLLGTLLLSLI